MPQLVLTIFVIYFALTTSTIAQHSMQFSSIQIKPVDIHSEHSNCIQNYLKPHLGKDLDNSDLQLFRQNINSNCFYQQGFINSGIIYPDQIFDKNSLIVELIEGEIESLAINDNQSLNSIWFNHQLAPAFEKPFQINHLRQSLLLMENHPLIKKIDAKLTPGHILGQGELTLKVVENLPYKIQFELNNTIASPSVGLAFFNLKMQHYSLTGGGDELKIDSSYSQGLKKLGLKYRYPLNHKSWLAIDMLSGHSEIIESPFKRLEISNQTDRFSVAFEYDLQRTLLQSWQISAGFTYERSESKLLGENFSFSPGVKNGKTQLSILDLGFHWSRQIINDRQVDQIWTLDNHWQIGVPIFSATKNNDDPDSRFLKWLIQAQWRKRLSQDGKYQLLTRLNAQWANTALLPLEVYSAGGLNSVRGYRQSQFSRDIGWSASINVPILIKSGWELTPFVDFGQAWNQDYQQRAKLLSVGLSLQWQLNKDWHFYSHYAKRLSETRSQGNSLQDKGLGFQLQYRVM